MYPAGGDLALIDGLRGPRDFRTGALAGLRGGRSRRGRRSGARAAGDRVTTGFLQDQNSWLFLPEMVEYSVSSDGKVFAPAATTGARRSGAGRRRAHGEFRVGSDREEARATCACSRRTSVSVPRGTRARGKRPGSSPTRSSSNDGWNRGPAAGEFIARRQDGAMVHFAFLDWFWLVDIRRAHDRERRPFLSPRKALGSRFLPRGTGASLVASRLVGLRDAHGDRHADVGGGGRVQARPRGSLVRLLRRVVRDKRVRLDEDIPPLARLQPGRMADAPLRRHAGRAAARMGRGLAGVSQYVHPRLGRHRHGQGLPFSLRLAAVDGAHVLLDALRRLRARRRLLGRRDGRFPAGDHRVHRDRRSCRSGECPPRAARTRSSRRLHEMGLSTHAQPVQLLGLHRGGFPRRVVHHDARHRHTRRPRHGDGDRLVPRGAAHPVGADGEGRLLVHLGGAGARRHAKRALGRRPSSASSCCTPISRRSRTTRWRGSGSASRRFPSG